MKLSPEAQNLLNCYLLDLKRRLPRGQREDICAERESCILDMLEERNPGAQDISRAQMAELLINLGSPKKMAATYSGEQYLIPPKLYPLFSMVTKIVLLVMAVVITVVLGLNFAINFNQADPLMFGFTLAGQLLSALTSVLGSLVIVFYLIQKFGSPEKIAREQEEETWTPDDLPGLEYATAPGKFETILDIVFLFVFCLFLLAVTVGNGLPIIYAPGEPGARIFAPRLTPYLPWLIGLSVPGLLKAVYFLVTNRWNRFLKLTDTLSEYLSVIALAIMAAAYPLFELRNAAGESSGVLSEIAPVVNGSVAFALCIAIVVILTLATIELVKYIRHHAS